MDLRINFSGRSVRYTEDEIATVVEAMQDAEPLTQGRYLQLFEEKFANYQNVAPGSCFATMNGCAALEMSAQLCAFNPGDEFVIPSHTFTASCYPYLKKAANPFGLILTYKLGWLQRKLLPRLSPPKPRQW